MRITKSPILDLLMRVYGLRVLIIEIPRAADFRMRWGCCNSDSWGEYAERVFVRAVRESNISIEYLSQGRDSDGATQFQKTEPESSA